jgi:pSer/pThr/pTyr-binding forkhead associated (FHA) protein
LANPSCSPGASSAPGNAYIRVLGGDLRGGIFRLDGKPIVIGSSTDVNLSLPDPQALGRHAGLRYHEGRWSVEDLTGNGLSVNDIPTSSRALSGGEILRVGATELQFSLEEPKTGLTEPLESKSPGRQDALMDLVVELGDARDQGRRIQLFSGQEVLLGRASDAQLVLHDCRSSRLHCRIEGDSREVAIVDLDSLNGTHVDGRQVQRAILRPGDTILVGRTSIRCLKS